MDGTFLWPNCLFRPSFRNSNFFSSPQYPFMALSSGMAWYIGVLGTGLLTMFYQGLFDLAKQFLDPVCLCSIRAVCSIFV